MSPNRLGSIFSYFQKENIFFSCSKIGKEDPDRTLQDFLFFETPEAIESNCRRSSGS